MPTKTSIDTTTLGCRLSLRAGYGMAEQLAEWAALGTTGYVCVANTHQVVLARPGTGLHAAMDNALAVTTDSQVLANALLRLGMTYPEPVLYGPDLMQAVISVCERDGLSLGLFGSTESTCDAVRDRAAREHPNLNITVSVSPPIGSLEELVCGPDLETVFEASPDVLLVSLGCPKQEQWMHLTNDQLPGVKIGLGGAFEFYGGVKSRSPAWVHRAGLEWFYRMCVEPRRLVSRYFINNPRFILLWLRAVARRRFTTT